MGDNSGGPSVVGDDRSSLNRVKMKNPLLLVILLVLVLMVTSEPEVGGEEEKKLCMRESRRVLKQIIKEMAVCNSQMKNQTKSMEEHSKKMGCVVKCILKAEKILDDNYKVTNATIEAAIGTRATGKRREIAISKFQQCNKKFGPALDPKEEYCGSYNRFGLCIQNAVADLCEIPPPM